jgi:hypothetical protein
MFRSCRREAGSAKLGAADANQPAANEVQTGRFAVSHTPAAEHPERTEIKLIRIAIRIPIVIGGFD